MRGRLRFFTLMLKVFGVFQAAVSTYLRLRNVEGRASFVVTVL